MRHGLSLRQLDAQVERWNRRCPVGTPVIYRSVIGEGHSLQWAAGKRTRTTTAASILSGHSAVVFVEGVSGCVALESLEVVEG